MEFRLIYQGPLKSNGSKEHKHQIRRALHPQLKELWNQPPLNDYREYLQPGPEKDSTSVIETVGNFQFAPLVTSRLNLIAELNIVLLRPGEPGRIVTTSGDIDNRLKTLFDALRCPENEQEIPKNEKPRDDETPFYCLMQNDALITSISVASDRLLLRDDDTSHVILLIHIRVKDTRLMRLGDTAIV